MAGIYDDRGVPLDMKAYEASLAAQVKGKKISQAAMDAELKRVKDLDVPAQAPLTGQANNYLAAARANLQQQVASGGITQGQADAELNRLTKEIQALPPALQDAKANLQQQVTSGGINQAQANNELIRLQGLANQSQPQVSPGLKLDTASDVFNATSEVARGATPAGNILTNPNVSNPLGGQTVSIDPVTGQPIVNQTLSQGNQQALSGIQGSSNAGNQSLQGLLGGGLLGNFTNPAPAGGPAPMSNFGQAIYNQLTSGLDKQKSRDREQLDQTLSNRGIPVGAEGYTNMMGDLDKRYDDIFSSARNQAVMGDVSASTGLLSPLSQIGQSGFIAPNLPGFNSVQYQQPDVGSIFGQLTGAQLTREGYENELKKQQMAIDAQNKSGGGGGGGGGSSGGGAPAFRTSSPPGS